MVNCLVAGAIIKGSGVRWCREVMKRIKTIIERFKERKKALEAERALMPESSSQRGPSNRGSRRSEARPAPAARALLPMTNDA